MRWSVLLEVGNGWAFVARQKRMTVDNDDFFLDLLFYSRPLPSADRRRTEDQQADQSR